MSDAPSTSAPAGGPAPHGDHAAHGHTNYVKIWGVLLGLLVVSVVGPMIGIQWLTLVTAFGIALIKAFLVIKYFMHLTVEKKYVGLLMLTMLAFMLVFVGAVSPDVMKHEGQRWENVAAKRVVDEGLKAEGGHGDAHHDGSSNHNTPAEHVPPTDAKPPTAGEAPAAAPARDPATGAPADEHQAPAQP